MRVQFLANYQHELGERERLGHVVARADLHRFDSRFDRPVGRHHNHGQRAVHALYGLQKFQPAHPGQAQVGHHKVRLFADQELQAGFRVRRRVNNEAFLAKLQLEQPPHFGFIFDDENCRFFLARVHGGFDAAAVRAVPSLCQPACGEVKPQITDGKCLEKCGQNSACSLSQEIDLLPIGLFSRKLARTWRWTFAPGQSFSTRKYHSYQIDQHWGL